MNVKDYVKDCSVQFEFYRDNQLWYKVVGGPTELEFPVPISDVGNATFKATDKALLFMRYIRKQIAFLNESKPECESCGDTGLMHFEGSPSKTLMGPCEHCEKGQQ